MTYVVQYPCDEGWLPAYESEDKQDAILRFKLLRSTKPKTEWRLVEVRVIMVD